MNETFLNTYSPFTQEEIDAHDNWVYELQVKIKRLHAAIGRMFEKELITADMIAEALDNNESENDLDSLKVIFCSWGGSKEQADEVATKFSLILKVIRSYQ